MSLPELKNWSKTRDSLHQAALVLGAVRKLLVERQPNFQHLSLQVVPVGLSTGKTSAGELILDFTARAVILDAGKQIRLEGLSQMLLTEQLVNMLAASGHSISPDRQHLNSETPFELDATQASGYAAALYTIYGAVRHFSQNLPGHKTPPVIWPHHFDLSFLWFAGEGTDEREDPHMNFGFSPYTEEIDGAYFYSYAWSKATGYLDIPTPPKTELVSGGSKYTVLSYDDVRQESDPSAYIQQHFQTLWESTRVKLDQRE